MEVKTVISLRSQVEEMVTVPWFLVLHTFFGSTKLIVFGILVQTVW